MHVLYSYIIAGDIPVCLQLKEIRALVIAGAADHDEFFTLLRSLEPAFSTSVKDLRSQVVRESCIAIS